MPEPGNINLFSRPRVKNPDGSVSTVYSMSFNEDGQEILIPRVERTGKGILDPKAAIDQYHATGEHLGKFATPEDATAYAQQLHQDFAAGKYDVPLASSRKSVDLGAFEKALLQRSLQERR